MNELISTQPNKHETCSLVWQGNEVIYLLKEVKEQKHVIQCRNLCMSRPFLLNGPLPGRVHLDLLYL